MQPFRIPFLALTIATFSCARKSDSEIIYTKFVNFDSAQTDKDSRPDSLNYRKGYKVQFLYNADGSLHQIKGKVLGQLYGHYFRMDDLGTRDSKTSHGRLAIYEYITTDSSFSYEVKLDQKQGEYSETGSPEVSHFPHKPEQNDSSKKYALYFSLFPRTKVTSFYSTDGKIFTKLNLRKSELIPLLDKADISISKKTSVIFVRTEAENLLFPISGLSNRKTFEDTIYFDDN